MTIRAAPFAIPVVAHAYAQRLSRVQPGAATKITGRRRPSGKSAAPRSGRDPGRFGGDRGGAGGGGCELRRRDLQVVAERPVDEALAAPSARAGGPSRRGGTRGTACWTRSIHSNFQRWEPLKAVVAGERLASRLARPSSTARSSRPQAIAEVEGGADPLGGQRQAVTGRVAGEEDAAYRSPAAAGGGSSCPGSGRSRGRVARRADTVGSLTWKRGSKEPTPTRSSSPPESSSRTRPGRRRARSRSRGPRRYRPDGPRGRARAGRRAAAVLAVAEDAAPAEGVDDERRRDDPAVGLRPSPTRRRCATASRGRRPWRSRTRRRTRAQRSSQSVAVVEGREGPGQVASALSSCGVWTTSSSKRLADRVHRGRAPRSQLGRGRAGGGLPSRRSRSGRARAPARRTRPARGRPSARRSWRRR